MPAITPFLWFESEAEEAAQFYTAIFPNAKITQITHYGEGMPRPKGSVMTVAFELDGAVFTALNGGKHDSFNDSISLVVHCKDQAEIDYYWEKLTDGGREVACGWLKDRYGVSWQIVPANLSAFLSATQPKVDAVMAAVMTMKKLDIAALEKARDGAKSET